MQIIGQSLTADKPRYGGLLFTNGVFTQFGHTLILSLMRIILLYESLQEFACDSKLESKFMSEVTTFFGVRKRGPFGLLFKWSFIIFNLAMGYLTYKFWPGHLGWIIIAWISGTLILGCLTYLTRVNEVEIILR